MCYQWNPTEKASDPSKGLPSEYSVRVAESRKLKASKQSKVVDSIVVFQVQYLKGYFSLRQWHMIERFLKDELVAVTVK